MWTVAERLLIGTDDDARDRKLLTDCGVTHIINCAAELKSYFPEAFTYTRLELTDPDQQFHQIVDSSAETIAAARSAGTVLIHCHGALSRSPAVILAYLCTTELSLIQAAETLANALPTRPNSVFLCQLLDRFPIDTDHDPVATLHAILGASG